MLINADMHVEGVRRNILTNLRGRADAKLNLLFAASLLAAVWCVCSVGVFPTQDGPVHKYYAHILSTFFHNHSEYSEAYSVRSFLPPYAIHYYLLVALGQVLTYGAAEKLILITVVIVTGLG